MWVIVSGAITYLFMLTDVLTYLLQALAWQGVFVTASVAIALVHIALSPRADITLPEVRHERLQPVAAGAVVWLTASALGIWLTEQDSMPRLTALAPLITVAVAAGGFAPDLPVVAAATHRSCRTRPRR